MVIQEATTTLVDRKSYKCKRVVRSSLAGETQANVETLDSVFALCFWTLGKA